MKRNISQEILKEKFCYYPETGKLIWKKTKHKRLIGKEAGAEIKSRGYRITMVGRKGYYVHRLIWSYMTGEFPETVDHINGDTRDNRFCNLRVATIGQNTHNQKKSKINTSGYKGVYFHKGKKRWRAHIRLDGKRIGLGHYKCPTAAYFAYCRAAKQYHGEFARLA